MGLYKENGIESVSIRDVAHRVGVSPASIYSFFKSRQALIEALWLDPILVLLAEMDRLAQATPDPVERIGGLLDLYVEFALSNPEIYRGALLHVRSGKQVPPTPRPLDQLGFYRLLRQAIADGQAKQCFRSGDPTMLAQTLWASVHGAIALPVHMEAWQLADQHQLLAQTREILMAGIMLQTPGRA